MPASNPETNKIPHLIQAEDLAMILRVNLESLYAYCDFFDQDQTDNWELVEGEHFVWANKKHGVRAFTHTGAIELAKYVETEVDNKNPLRKFVKTFIDRKQAQFVRALVMTRVSAVGSINGAIQIHNGRPFVTTRQTRYILRLHTRQDVLRRAIEHEQKGDSGRAPMKAGTHFITTPDEEHPLYSAEGIKRLSMGLQNVCKSRATRSWNSAVEGSIFKTIKEVAKPLLLDDKELKRAVQAAKTKAKQRCEITGQKKSKLNPSLQLAVHHLYDSKSHAFLRCESINLIVINAQLHDAFHAWMGGTKKSCSGEDLLQWLQMNSDEIFRNCDDPISQQAMAITTLQQRLKILLPAVAAHQQQG